MTDHAPAAPRDLREASLDEGRTRARRQGTRLVFALFLAFVVAFVLTCTYEIVGAAHGFYRGELTTSAGEQTPTMATPSTLPVEGRDCTEGIRRLLASLDAAVVAARTEGATDETTAIARFNQGLAPEWAAENGLRGACDVTPRGPDAFAALLRLRLAQEGLLRRQAVEIAPIRRDVMAYLPR